MFNLGSSVISGKSYTFILQPDSSGNCERGIITVQPKNETEESWSCYVSAARIIADGSQAVSPILIQALRFVDNFKR